ncbi:TRAP transporter large permease subunit [Leisingera daeponensis]|uniref:TRAP transporter large permease protein n=1 Tax=Leisingera daeponensis TaxID=405746 RepID=A0ABS7NHL5_9RHOB|nr:TRAP transporter large permease subunit [Leisingera daeponensis]MBY6140685.1 TRAP transporter large permease subunit [Leisingera daeponensis]
MIPLLMFAALFALVFAGIPVAFSMMIVAVAFGYAVFGDMLFLQLYGPLLHTASNFVLAAIPLFIFMGAVLERSGIAKRLFHALQIWLGGLPGGLALSTIAMCAIFAAASGVVGAVEIVVGLMAIPAMRAAGYRNDLIAGTICAGGSLGTVIPPSVIVVVYASIAQLSIGQLFAASILPGVLMVAFFVGYVLLRSLRRPDDAPVLPTEGRALPTGQKLKITVTALVPPLLLIAMVLGSLLAGAASATEAAAVGAAGTLVLTCMFRELSFSMLRAALGVTLRITAMIMLIVAGGTMFTSIFAVTGGGGLVRDTVEMIGYGNAGLIAFLLLVVFFAGFVLDWVSIVLIFVPIFAPLVRSAGIDPVWFAMLVLVVIQTSYLTPPMAPSIFYLRSIAPKDMTYGHMYRGVLPFVAAQGLVLAALLAVPELATWLPSILVGL